MNNETIKELHQKHSLELTEELGHFNVVAIDDFSSCNTQPIPFSRRNYYKISLLKGNYKVHYADKTFTIKRQALLFANPSIPYNWVPKEGAHRGIYCVFTPEFFHQFGDINSYSVFHSNGTHVIELHDEQCDKVENLFNRMQQEFNSDYRHKFDLMRNLVFEIMHFATKLTPDITDYKEHGKAAQRITRQFLDLLERQFPIETTDQQLSLTSPVDFADELALHVNYLNRVLKKTMGQSTSQLIQQRIIREARILLKHSTINISQIAYLLGFKEVSHFSNFFSSHEGINPSDYRKV